jgi:NAD(P)H-hydrate epimerase
LEAALNTLADKLTTLFKETGHAHHQAYLATDGADAEWPLWYADYLEKRLPDLLGVRLTKSEIVYLMVLLSKQQPPNTDWTQYYAAYMVDKYGQKS